MQSCRAFTMGVFDKSGDAKGGVANAVMELSMRRTRGLLDEQHVTRTINAVAAAGLEVVRVEIDWEGKIALTTACAVGKNRGAIVSDSEERKKHSQTNAFEAIGREYLRHEVKRGLPSTRQYRWTLER